MTARLSAPQRAALTLAARPAGVTRGHDLLTRTDVTQPTLDSLRRMGLIAPSGASWPLSTRLIATVAGVAELPELPELPDAERTAAIARWEAVKFDIARSDAQRTQLAAALARASMSHFGRLGEARAAAVACRAEAQERIDAARQIIGAREQQIAKLDTLLAELDEMERTWSPA
jgi:hypothetical protein